MTGAMVGWLVVRSTGLRIPVEAHEVVPRGHRVSIVGTDHLKDYPPSIFDFEPWPPEDRG